MSARDARDDARRLRAAGLVSLRVVGAGASGRVHEVLDERAPAGSARASGRRAASGGAVDLGLARDLDADTALTASGSWVGTCDDLSPELVLGQPVGPPSDLFSLGATLFHALVGAVPFTAPNALALALGRKIARERAPGPAPPPAHPLARRDRPRDGAPREGPGRPPDRARVRHEGRLAGVTTGRRRLVT